MSSVVDMTAHVAILRMVALTAVADARAAWRSASADPTEENTRTALRACTLAKRALLRASEQHPDEEAMIERAMLLAELSVGLTRKLVRLPTKQ